MSQRNSSSTSSGYKKSSALFSDVPCASFTCKSTWNKPANKKVKDFSGQTDPELYEFTDMDVQTGLYAEVCESEITKSTYAGLTVFDYLFKMYGKADIYKNKLFQSPEDTRMEVFTALIEDGCVKINGAICKEPQQKLELNSIVELVLHKCNVATQKDKQSDETKEEHDVDERRLASFLSEKIPVMYEELDVNYSSKAFDGYEAGISGDVEDITFWSSLTVDLEKHKVLYPDWSTAKYVRGRISKCFTKSNKERVYDVDYEDGTKQYGVREEHIIIEYDPSGNSVNPSKKSAGTSKANAPTGPPNQPSKLFEGLRVHVKDPKSSSGPLVQYIPGRVVKARSGGFNVECEGDLVVRGVSTDDVMVGIDELQAVRAKQPEKSKLQCTGVSWNASGSFLAVAFGRRDLTGWCDTPGAVCIWKIFSKTFNPSEPDIVLDHSSGAMCVKFHPENPSLIAGGFFSGEVVVWDINKPQSPLGVTAMTEYAHKEPVTSLNWMFHTLQRIWLVVSTGADGKLLLWNYQQGARDGIIPFPVKGTLLRNSKLMKK